ncbi:MAG: CocE/NonD family hydrolase [Tannerella sp.]|jgi:putative CocE/NonD family hydrolase|nr:CocE/NonD family hydrolase [Tannerella sp.]
MKHFKNILLILALTLAGHAFPSAQTPAAGGDAEYIRTHYTKIERMIPMRDGVKLFTAIYVPNDRSEACPILLSRTPYTVSPYGEDRYRASLGPSAAFAREGYIFAYQDIRGRWMSEGEFVDDRPYIPDKKSRTDVDESSDTYDTIEWLVKNIEGNNGRVGIYGISYPGFYATCGLLDSHPALKAASPQAPVTDLFVGDDTFHNGAFFLLGNFAFYATFGQVRPAPTSQPYYAPVRFGTEDAYRFFLENTYADLKEKYLHDLVPIWDEMTEHDTYDAFWQSRTPLPHLRSVKPAVLTVGGWYDAEDLYGPLKTYATIRKNSPDTRNHLVMGPWPHGGWSRGNGDAFGNVRFDSNTSEYYRDRIELPFFNRHLKGVDGADIPAVSVFVTGSNRWHTGDTWPPAGAQEAFLYLGADGSLSFDAAPEAKGAADEYVSDPARPVPYTQATAMRPVREYMIEDQRFAASRPDVMVYRTPVLEEDVTLSGPLAVELFVSTTGTDADFAVKLIDVYPDTTASHPDTPPGVRLSAFQQLVRGDIIRAKFRNSLERPEPLTSGEVTKVPFELRDIAHTFRKGHRIMVQVQSSWFPLVDRNPQQFMDVFKASAADYRKATHRIYLDGRQQSRIGVKRLTIHE